ncbi:MAG: hypothetical protein GTO45_19580 [Candidatus Aminicenantes bacterium]|nr:hypothetical protein [Candidatus Aminicenantes bacterium]NIN44145.1 hypothetical protein [Candidatus Aminicenantes bacterium]NIN86963.1 hypothetical protein [Candidatus Aminicenantes bacterium]NIR11105.1 hypothetical protein [Candidatus Aminicenantes bacterium]NIT28674.1 hypothetical protein [Candidatus Aminicenantes bacterium]
MGRCKTVLFLGLLQEIPPGLKADFTAWEINLQMEYFGAELGIYDYISNENITVGAVSKLDRDGWTVEPRYSITSD